MVHFFMNLIRFCIVNSIVVNFLNLGVEITRDICFNRKKDGSTISAKSKTHYDYEMNETPTETAGVYESSLVINDMKSDLAGSYECFVVHKSNRVEDPTGGINLTVPRK